MAAIASVLMIVVVVRLVVSGAASLSRSGASESPDPQFAEPAIAVTRPPEMKGEAGMAPVTDDPSAGWEETGLTPVDKTAQELGREEAAED